jgi:hypothetical protein
MNMDNTVAAVGHKFKQSYAFMDKLYLCTTFGVFAR